jgi:hypothetical protein
MLDEVWSATALEDLGDERMHVDARCVPEERHEGAKLLHLIQECTRVLERFLLTTRGEEQASSTACQEWEMEWYTIPPSCR